MAEDKQKDKIKKILRHSAPLVIGASSFLSWFPVSLGSAEILKDKNVENIETLADKRIFHKENKPLLAIADKNSINAYSQSIGQISINTEAGEFKNPPSIATGNGYYGQYQLGNSYKNDFCVKKYIAFALANSSPELKKSLCDNMLRGNQTTKDKLIEAFASSIDKYDEQQQSEYAYHSTNPAYKKLSAIINVTPTTFIKAHKKFEDEAGRLQSRFIYEVYLQQMSVGIKGIIAQNPQIKFESIRPAVMASVVAIAIKQGNGRRFKNAMEQATISAYQRQANKSWEAGTAYGKTKQEPLAVACRTGDINKENIAVTGNIIRIYDTDNSGIKSKDILAPEKYQVMVVRGQKPKNVTSSRSVVTFNTQKDAVDIAEIVNTKGWLEKYCGSFKAVYKQAVCQMDKLPTVDTYYELSLIFNKPDLYKIAEDCYRESQFNIVSNNLLINKAITGKHQNA